MTLKRQRKALLQSQWVTSHKLDEPGLSSEQHYWRTLNDYADKAVTVTSTTFPLVAPEPYHFPPGADRVGLFDHDKVIIVKDARKALRLAADRRSLAAGQTRSAGSTKLLRLNGQWDWAAMKPIGRETEGQLRFRLRLMADMLPDRH